MLSENSSLSLSAIGYTEKVLALAHAAMDLYRPFLRKTSAVCKLDLSKFLDNLFELISNVGRKEVPPARDANSVPCLCITITNVLHNILLMWSLINLYISGHPSPYHLLLD